MIVLLFVSRRSAALRAQPHLGDHRGGRLGNGERGPIGLHGPGNSQLRADREATQRLGHSDADQWNNPHMRWPRNRYEDIQAFSLIACVNCSR